MGSGAAAAISLAVKQLSSALASRPCAASGPSGLRLEVPFDAEQRHQMLRAAALELEDVGLVVSNVADSLCQTGPSPSSRQRRSVWRLTCQRSATSFSVITG